MNIIILALRLKLDLLLLQQLQDQLNNIPMQVEAVPINPVAQDITGIEYIPPPPITYDGKNYPWTPGNEDIISQIQTVANKCSSEEQQTESYYSGFVGIPGCGPAGVNLASCNETGVWKQDKMDSILQGEQSFCNNYIDGLQNDLKK